MPARGCRSPPSPASSSPSWSPVSSRASTSLRSAPTGFGRCSRRFGAEALDSVQVVEHGLERLDVAELRVDVEQVPLDHAGDSVADALADDDRPEAVADRVLDRVPDAAGHGHAGDDYRVDAGGAEHVRDGRAEEGACVLLDDHVLAGLG